MISPGVLRAFLESGCALIVASVGEGRRPHASRGWGLDVVSDDRVRLVVDAGDLRLHANLAAHSAIAVTATDVKTLRSAQLKGSAELAMSEHEQDLARMRRYCDLFFADVQATDGVGPELMERIVPAALAVYDIDVHAVFDQTPGPQAGSMLER